MSCVCHKPKLILANEKPITSNLDMDEFVSFSKGRQETGVVEWSSGVKRNEEILVIKLLINK